MKLELPSHLRPRALELGDRAADSVLERMEGYSFMTYACGAQLPEDLERLSPIVQSAFRKVVRDRLWERLAAAWPDRVHVENGGEVTSEVAPRGGDVKIRIQPLFVAGRYRKLVRGISQTVFHCRKCRGRRNRAGCPKCGGSGRLFAESVEDFVCRPLRSIVRGQGASFHGSGREDVDVRMLGDGRPFVVSIRKPKARIFDTADLERRVADYSAGRVLVSELRVVGRKEMKRLTSEHGAKVYRAVIAPVEGAPLPADAVERVEALAGVELAQRTPQRVAERRGDVVRRRRILGVSARIEGEHLVAELETEAGTYVKEFISGDGGRTEPSMASVLGVPVVCAELDVLSVGD